MVGTSPALTCQECGGSGIGTIPAIGIHPAITTLCGCVITDEPTCPMCNSPMDVDGDDDGSFDLRCFGCKRHISYHPSRGYRSEIGDWGD
jgi:hypothetical protein